MTRQVSLPSGARHAIVYPPTCLEAGKRYKVKLEFKSYDSRQETPSASVLIDSIAVVPRPDSIPFFSGNSAADYRRQEFDHYRCTQYFYSVVKADIPEVCKKHLYSVGLFVLGSGFECQCDPTGSYSGICDSLGKLRITRLKFIEINKLKYYSIAFWMFYQSSFGSHSIRRSLGL